MADETWDEPLDPTYAAAHGGRWNPPSSFPVLSLNEDLATARSQIQRMLDGQPANPEDLDPPYVLVAATLPRGQRVADAVTDAGLDRLGLPATYPVGVSGDVVPWADCQPVGAAVHQRRPRLNGIRARSAATRDGSGRELAWFPARHDSRARPVGPAIPFDDWWATDPVWP